MSRFNSVLSSLLEVEISFCLNQIFEIYFIKSQILKIDEGLFLPFSVSEIKPTSYKFIEQF